MRWKCYLIIFNFAFNALFSQKTDYAHIIHISN